MKYLVTMVEDFSDGTAESGMCAPTTFDDIIEASSSDEAELFANQKWEDCGCILVRKATKEDIQRYEEVMSCDEPEVAPVFVITEYVKASSIWETAEDFEDEGSYLGLVRGYNIEIKCSDGSVGWHSSNWIHEDPEVYFNDEFHRWYYQEHGWTPTGRICFRGYGEEEYDFEERDTFITNVGSLSSHIN